VNSKMAEERRRYIRRSLMLKVVCLNADDPRRRMETTSTDISLGGIGLKIKNFMSRDLDLRIYGPSSRKPIMAKGTVVWQNLLKGRAGIQFTSIGWNDIKSLI